MTGERISRHAHRRWLYAYVPPYRWWKHSKLYQRLAHKRLLRSVARCTAAMQQLGRAAEIATERLRKP